MRRGNSSRTNGLLAAAAATLMMFSVNAQADTMRHGVSLFGNLKYAEGFKHFDYVNAGAPKGGTLRYAVVGGFDSLNNFIIKGDAAVGLNFIYDTLLESSLDEPGSEYGLIASAVSYPDDFSSATFTLRKEARFNDGTPITAEDVVWSFKTLTTISQNYKKYYFDVSKAEVIALDKVQFSFSIKGNRELPLILGQMPVLPKHFWTAKGANGKARDITLTSLEAPLGSGPYRISEVKPGNSITYERVKDYWAKDLPVKVGTNNFDQLRFVYYLDPDVALVAFTGDRADLRIENSSKNWATRYDIPAVKDGRIVREELPTQNGQGMQGFAFNLRRAVFQDPRVREAFNLAFDFEWANKTLFYGQYTRSNSYFANTELASSGLPSADELKLLEPLRAGLPPDIFTTPYNNPVTDGSGNNRDNLRRAAKLLEDAGWKIVDGKRVNAKGEPLSVEFLIDNPTFERVVSPYRQSLGRLGINVVQRTVDSSQYQNRVNNYDFDIIVQTFGQSLSPGNEQREFWGCDAAKEPGTRNVIGICDPAIEKLIDKVIFAKSRAELITATRALDRVLLSRHYVVPQWYLPSDRIAYWARLAHPDPMPAYSNGFPDIWWFKGKDKTATPANGTAP